VVAVQSDDAKLVEGLLHKTEEASQEFLRRYASPIRSYLLRACGNPEDAKDLTMEVVIKVHTRISQYRPERGSFKRWLWAIVVNTRNDWLREKRSRPEMVSLDDLSDDELDSQLFVYDIQPDDEEGAGLQVSDEKLSAIRRILDTLSDRDRKIVEMVLSRTPRDLMADTLGLPQNSLRKAIFDAKKRLIAKIAQDPVFASRQEAVEALFDSRR
jgi:RNA polymerase sigma factor (sigma-70 family)